MNRFVSGAQVRQETDVCPAQFHADVVIVGAGISGLSLAWRLQQISPTLRLAILEAADRPGGTAWTDYQDGFLIEHGANGFLANKTATLDLIRELGLENEIITANPTARFRYLLHDGKLYLLPAGLWSLFRFPLLSWRAKWAILTERWRPGKSHAGDESVYDFIARRTNREVAELFADLLVTGIYAGDPRQLSTAACFPRIVEMVRQTGSVTAGMLKEARRRKTPTKEKRQTSVHRSQLYSLRRGMRQLVELLAQRLGAALHLQSPVDRLVYLTNQTGHCWHVHSTTSIWCCRHLVLACPAYIQADLLRPLDQELAGLIAAIPYVPVAVIALGYRADQLGLQIQGFGYLTAGRSTSRLLGSQWCSSIFPDRAPTGHVLMRYMAGGARHPEMLELSDETLIAEAHGEASRVLAIRGAPVYSQVIRWPHAIPQYTLGHLDRLIALRNLLGRWHGLSLAGNAYDGVSLNDCVERANKLSAQIIHQHAVG